MIFEVWLFCVVVSLLYIVQTRVLEGNYELRETLHLGGLYRILCIVFSPFHEPLDDSDPFNIRPQSLRRPGTPLQRRMYNARGTSLCQRSRFTKLNSSTTPFMYFCF